MKSLQVIEGDFRRKPKQKRPKKTAPPCDADQLKLVAQSAEEIFDQRWKLDENGNTKRRPELDENLKIHWVERK